MIQAGAVNEKRQKHGAEIEKSRRRAQQKNKEKSKNTEDEKQKKEIENNNKRQKSTRIQKENRMKRTRERKEIYETGGTIRKKQRTRKLIAVRPKHKSTHKINTKQNTLR